MENNILSYLDLSAKRVPDKTAYSTGTEGYTFREIYEMSRSSGTWIHNFGLFRKPVIVFMERHPKMIAAFLGVVTAGCFYVPVDEEMPAGRIEKIIETCEAELIICDRHTEAAAKKLQCAAKVALYDDLIKTSEDTSALLNIRKSALDADPVYVVFTSGSTGQPKGVAACHRSVIDYIEQLSEILGFSENTIFANQTPLYFDACLKEIYPVLKFGATAYIVPKKLFSFPVDLVAYLNRYRVNTICWVVSAMTMISAFGTFESVKPKHLTTVAFGSEVFPKKQFAIWRDALPGASFTNLYGPTEGTGMCCYYHVERELAPEEAIPIGRPFPNTEILLLDENDRPANEGEICIRGASVALGYYNDPERTAKSFVQNPLVRAWPDIIYRTGDTGRYNDHGELVFVSRKDNQIKHMGHRVELGEIEAEASGIEGVDMCACVYNREKGKIMLYYQGDISGGDLVAELKKNLPRYMIPNRVRRLDTLPQTPNGKIDRALLKDLK